MRTAVFIDVKSIQRYIFSSNSLKENIGASYIVKKIFDDLEKFKHSYIGGGNALLYFDNEEQAKNEMKNWSRNLLKTYPGIIPIIVIEPEFDEKDYEASRNKIIKKALEFKNQFIPVTRLSSFGFTANCHRTGLSCEVFSEDINDKTYISSESYVKLKASNETDREIEDRYKDILDDKKFTSDLGKIGGTKGEKNYIAIVHIDGNDIGEKIKNIKNEERLSKFSGDMKNAVESAFKEVLEQLVKKDWREISKELDIKGNYLPIRPIIIGGDDITFVCDARLGLYFTYHFIKYFEDQEICKKNDITACGGISIVKTKYPFYRAYTLSEELCANAKKKRKEKVDNGSWIDFHISTGGVFGNLEYIREESYKSIDDDKLYKRPYKFNEIPKFLKSVKKLKELPQSKVKEFRDILYQGATAANEFIKELKYRDNKLPVFSHSDEAEKGFVNKETPYIDMIEMIDFCPDYFIEEVGNEQI